MLCFTLIDSTVQGTVTDPCNCVSPHFSPDLQGLKSLIKKKTNSKHQNKQNKEPILIQKSRAVKAEIPILSVNNFPKFLLQDLECDSKILQHAHGVGGIEITFRV